MSEPLIDGDFNRAIREHSKAIALNPESAEVYNNRGNIYRDKGEVNRAITDHSKAIYVWAIVPTSHI